MGWLDSVTHSMDVKLCKLREMVGFPGGSSGREPACQCRKLRDAGLIPWLGRSPGEGNGYPLQYSCLENPMNRGAWWATVFAVTRSWIHLVIQQEQLYTSRDFQALTCAR